MKRFKVIIILIVLMVISVLNNYYASNFSSLFSNYFIKQGIWFLISFGFIYLLKFFNVNFIIDKSIFLYVLGIVLLIITYLFGTDVNGSRSWLKLGFISIQASEFMRSFLMIYLYHFKDKYSYLSDFKFIVYSFMIVLVPSVLTFIEPDTGGVILYLSVWLFFIILKKINKFYYIGGSTFILVFLGLFFFLYFKRQELFINLFGTSFFYRMDRLVNLGDGYQINEAIKSISNSGLFGIKNYIYFPEAPTDFAFTLLIANFGYIGMSILLLSYFLLFKFILEYSYDDLSRCFVFTLMVQFCINIFMNIGLFPIIGITLPFISYGGSSVLSYMFVLSFILNKNKA